MRLSSLLPMLLLLVSPLTAQQNCEIFDLTATVVQVNPNNNCEFFVVLDFKYSGTSNTFTVNGNGTNYGTFEYSQVPLTLGPLFANPNSSSVFEFIVQDAEFQGCFDDVTIDVPACGIGSGCDIFDLTVDVGPCNFQDTTYALTLNFQFASSGVIGEFQVFSANGVSLGIFPLAALPLTIPNFPWGGGPFDVLTVCIVNQPNCCETITYNAPGCFNPGCGIVDLEVIPGNCVNDSTYKALIKFHVVNISSLTDTFQLFLDGVSQGFFGVNQLPLPILFPTNGNPHPVVKVCIDLPVIGLCCAEADFTAPDCFIPCAIHDLHVETDSCTTDSTFGVWLNFTVSDPTAVDSFDLWGNGQPLGQFGMDQLPLHIDDFLWNGLIFNQIRVCTGNLPGCCKELQFLAPDCLPYDSCEVTNIFVDTGNCTSDSTYQLFLNFNATNPGNGTFIVWANGTILDTFDLNEAPILIQDFPWNGGTHDIVTVCIGGGTNIPGTDPASLCCKSAEFPVPDCLGSCTISDLKLEIGDCDPATGTYPLTINFNFAHPGNDFFDVYSNGVLIGTFPLNQLPLTIPDYPSSGSIVDVIRVCINDHPDCCAVAEFQTPDCGDSCHIFNLVIDAGNCNLNSNTYPLFINFEVTDPGSDFFDVWANGQLFGTFPINQLPITIPNFPASGNASDHVKVCINDQPDCCIDETFLSPCSNLPCNIFDLVTEAGPCDTSNNTYSLFVNFQVTNPGNDFFEVWANGQFFGTYALSLLPFTIPNFPASGNAFDDIKICINDHPDCCVVKEFPSPCFDDQPCHIFDLEIVVGDCNAAGGFPVTIDFEVTNPGNDFFEIFINGQLFGFFPLNQLPFTIQNFPASGNPVDVIKICINDHPDCCVTEEIHAPNCDDDCAIHDLAVQTGDCNPDSTYNVWVNFIPVNTNITQFVVFGNGIPIGTFDINQLPLHIPSFPWDGMGPNDVLTVCMVTGPNDPDCCATIEFPIPACLPGGGNCDINDLHVDTGNCTSDSSYQLTFNFQVVNPIGNTFGVWANGQFLGMFGLGQLPITIQDFPWDGGAKDVLKVCMGVNTPGSPQCCAEIEFFVPDCLTNHDCEIYDLLVDTGDCTSDSAYNLLLNFQVQNPLSNLFGVWSNGVLLGNYNLNQLPLPLNILWNGGTHDVIKVCMIDTSGSYGCCKTIEYPVPNCLGGGNCEIFGLVVDPGDCTSDSTYNLFINFQFVNPPSNMFGVWANGVFLGSFNVNQLPLNFPNFPWDGGPNDIVKVCFMNSSGGSNCCKTLEFAVPDCLNNGNDCHIWDVMAVRTPCLCGQFFVAITFNHANGSGSGFDLVGNGNVYGTYPYNVQQPIILGPFPGDGMTFYEFGVVDHELGDCEDGFVLGVVNCMTPVSEPGSASSLNISPNPASNWVNVAAMLENGVNIGQATVNIYHADGRLIQSQVIGNATNFQLDISNIPAGVYRLSVLGDSGRLEGSFVKQ